MRSDISRFQSVEPEVNIVNEDDESSENEDLDEIFSSINQHDNALYRVSFEKDFYNSYSTASNIPLFVENTNCVNSYPTNQPPLENNMHTLASSTKNRLFFQDKNHLIRWLEIHKDIILQALNISCSLSSVSNDVS